MKKLLTILFALFSASLSAQTITEMAIAEYKSAALRSDGSVWAPYWIGGTGTKMVKISGSMHFTQIDGGQYNHVLLRDNGGVYLQNNGNTSLQYLQFDSDGNTFTATWVECYFQCEIAVSTNGKIYFRGYNHHNWVAGGTNLVLNAWTLIPNQPAGVTFTKTRKGGPQGTGQLLALTNTGAVYTVADNTTTWNLKSLPGAVDDIYASRNNFYLVTIDGLPYGWGRRKFLNNGSGSINTYEALADDWSLGAHTIIDMAVNDNTIHYITDDHKLYGLGNNAVGEVGLGWELVNRKEIYAGDWYVWDWMDPESGSYPQSFFVGTPQQVRPGKLFKRVWASDYMAFYCFAQDYSTDSIYFWGRSKGAVGFTDIGWSNESTMPNAADVLTPTVVDVFGSVTPSPDTFVPGTVNAGSDQAINSSSTTLSGSRTFGHTNNWSYSAGSYAWTKVSGPACTIASPSSLSTSVTGMSVGTYTFQLKVTDNNTATYTDNVTVTVSSVPLSIAASANYTGGGNASLMSTVTSPDGIQFVQWSVYKRPGLTPVKIFCQGSSTMNGTGAITFDSAYISIVKRKWQADGLIDTMYLRALGGTDTRHGLPNSTNGYGVASFDTSRTVTSAIRKGVDLVLNHYASNSYGDPRTVHEHVGWWRESKDSANANGIDFWIFTTQPRTDGSAPAIRFRQARDSVAAVFPNNFVDCYKPLAQVGGTTIRADLSAGDNIHTNRAGHRILANNVIATNPLQNLTKGTAVFANKNTQNTTVSGLTEGTWTLMASVQDTNGYMAYQLVTIDVPAAPTNEPPTVDAGEDQTVNDSATILTGSADDADGTISSYQWVKISGPADEFIAEASSPSTTISFVNSGTYVFKLIAFDDDGASSEDTITVTVNVPVTPVQRGIRFKRFGKINFNRPE